MLIEHNLGFPRIGIKRELKKACELYWSKKIDYDNLLKIGKKIKLYNWKIQKNLDLIPCNDFSFYDQVLDQSMLLGVLPDSYTNLNFHNDIDLYFSMARGYQTDKWDIKAMEMTKWFNTNYHYIVPKFNKNQKFFIYSNKIFDEIEELKTFIKSIEKIKPVLIGPVSYLSLGKENEKSFHKMDLINNLIPIYINIIKKLMKKGIKWVQLDEPILSLDLSIKEKESFQYAYQKIYNHFLTDPINIILTSYFEGISNNLNLLKNLNIKALHIDLVEDSNQLEEILDFIKNSKTILSLGIIDGRNIWKNNYLDSIKKIIKSIHLIGKNRIMIAPNCSLMHVPIDLDEEINLDDNIKKRMAFAKQKINEISFIKKIIITEKIDQSFYELHKKTFNNPSKSKKYDKIQHDSFKRKNPFKIRQKKQQKIFNLPLFPTTTIGSFPQTKDIRNLRNQFRKNELSKEIYEKKIKEHIKNVIKTQESLGLDVLVHGEFERTDMVEFFSEKLDGILSTKNGWVQSYGSRCVKPPVIYDDIVRKKDMTINWISYAQSNTVNPVKGMLTGPVTILKWSFVRNDQPVYQTAYQIAWVIREEVLSLEKSGIKIIQIDEPALREGLPLRKKKWKNYFQWAIKSFRISSSGVKDETQIHTHMCYSKFNNILKEISDLDADVITIESSRSNMELLEDFSKFSYPNEIGPGVYDIHSPRIPNKNEIFNLIKKACSFLPKRNIWINPDCGLKTRKWNEVIKSIKNMVHAAKMARLKLNN